MPPADLTAVVVTRGDRDIRPVLESLAGFGEVLVWNNRERQDYKVFGRFMGAGIARHDYIYVQDDDCIIDAAALVAKFDPEAHEVLVNMPEIRRPEYAGTGIALIGWGCVFHRATMDVFASYFDCWPNDELFKRECDRVFSYLNRNRVRLTEVRMRQLDYAFGQDRMGTETRHRADFIEVRRRLAVMSEGRIEAAIKPA